MNYSFLSRWDLACQQYKAGKVVTGNVRQLGFILGSVSVCMWLSDVTEESLLTSLCWTETNSNKEEQCAPLPLACLTQENTLHDAIKMFTGLQRSLAQPL